MRIKIRVAGSSPVRTAVLCNIGHYWLQHSGILSMYTEVLLHVVILHVYQLLIIFLAMKIVELRWQRDVKEESFN